jgi:hypothetical protein
MADALEAQARNSLPPVEGLDQATTDSERMRVYEQLIRQQRDEFVAMYGDPFGWEKRSTPREESPQTTGNFADYVVGAG